MIRVGWRIVEVEKGKQARLETILAGLSSRTYSNRERLLNDAELAFSEYICRD
jgi:hypothetical protein